MNLKKLSDSLVDGYQSLHFDNPQAEDIEWLQNLLETDGILPASFGGHKLFVGVFNDTDGNLFLTLNYKGVKSVPFKGKVTVSGTLLEFSKSSILASNRGRILYPEDSQEAYLTINKIASLLGFKYNKNGEFLKQGATSGWS